MTHRLRLTLAASLLVVVAWAAYAVVSAPGVIHAQDAPPQPPTFRAEANYVRVDVYPTLNGVPIPDLRQDEFEILDNGVPQKIEQFERVQIRAAGPQETRIEPNTVRESRQMLQDSRARVFVLFLDTYHVEIEGSHNIRAPLVHALDQIIGPDDLVGVMTPEMSAADVTFARKTTTIDGFLTRYWYWGERERLIPVDPQDSDYYVCYPGTGPVPGGCRDDDRGIAAEMIERRHEKLTLDALADLVTFLRGVREERKAILAVSDGWRLFRPDPTLARQLYCQPPTGPQVGIDPRSGRPTTKAPPGPSSSTQADCDRDRMALSQIDDDLDFRRLLDEANRANASFYPIDPRGLAVFDTPIAPVLGPTAASSGPVVPPSVDSAMLRNRINSLRTLAEATDGLAIVNSNDLASGLQRVVNDLTSYYLLGYYTTAPLDGKFHSIKVRVKRPGVQVRARRGYLAPTAAEVSRAAAAPAPPSPAEAKATAEAHAIGDAIAPLAGYTRELPLRLQTVSTPTRVWVAGELGASEARNWSGGGSVDLLLTNAGGDTVGSARATIAAGSRTFEVAIPVTAAGDYNVRVRARTLAPDAMPINGAVKVSIGSSPAGARFVRRGPTTATRETPAADLRFRRGDTIRVEWPLGDQAGGGQARLLDRTGKALGVPVVAATREADGTTWRTAQVALAPLAPGDYVIELTVGSERRLAAFRVVP